MEAYAQVSLCRRRQPRAYLLEAVTGTCQSDYPITTAAAATTDFKLEPPPPSRLSHQRREQDDDEQHQPGSATTA